MRHSDIDVHALRALLGVALAGLMVFGVALARTETAPKPQIAHAPPQFDLQLSAGGDAFEFTGLVDFGLTAALRALMAAHPEVKRIALASQGGYIAEARGAVRVLREEGFSTHVVEDCASACALIFAAGKARTIAPEARIGLHGYALRTGASLGMIDPVAEMQRDLAIYRAQGVEESFIAHLARLPQSPMWYPSQDELRAAGFVTGP